MRVPPLVVVTAALAFKLWLWWRTAPAEVHHIICIVALWFFVAIMASIWMQRTEPKQVHEPFCADREQRRRVDWDYELCEWKLRDVRSGHSALRGIIA
jgi:hypothetical protein